MKLFIYSVLSCLLCFSCATSSSKNEAPYAYFGGEIINPNSKFITLSDDEHKTDTIRLDGRNRFIFKIDSLKEGVYSFKHGGEYQSFLVEESDSILLRLNTLEFDESLVYTGKGAKKNNYFINEFLENEKDEKHILKLCQLNAEDYQKRMDSLKNIKYKALSKFSKKYDTSELFEKIAKANIDYYYYSSKEVYPIIHHGKHKGKFLKSLPEDFYSYRKNINYNDDFFKNYHNYHTFLRHNFNTISLSTHTAHAKNKAFNWGDLCYNLDRLHLIDSLVTNPTIKDQLLYHFTIKYLSYSNDDKKANVILNSFLKKSSNERSKDIMTNYARSLKKLQSGSEFPNFEIVDYNKQIFNINDLISQPTVVSFWSHKYYDHFKKSFKKIKKLKDKYPDIRFITINVDDGSCEKSKQTFKDCRFDWSHQYMFKTPEATKKELAIYPMTKTIIIDGDNKIVSSNSNMFSVNFEKQITRLSNP